MQPRGDFWLEAEAGADVFWDEIDFEAGAAHEDLCAWTAIGKDELPFFTQGLGVMRGEPVLVVEQDEVGVFAGVLAEEIRDRGGVGLQPVHTSAENVLVFAAEVVWAAGQRVAAGDVHSPEVVIRCG